VTAPTRRADGRPRLSIVIPMLDEAGNIPALFARLFPVLDACGESFEIVAIDDGSTDATLEALRAQHSARPELRIVSFARNFGQHAAVMAGFEAALGDWIITLDADLQNPPEEIPHLVQAFRDGHDLVNTWREGREDPYFRKLASRAVNRFMRSASGISLRDFGCMLRGYHRLVITPMVRRREYHTFIPALAMLHARNPVEIPVRHAAREHGRSNYSLRRLFSLQLDLITSFSIAPLRLLFVLGSGIAALGTLFGVFLLVMRVLRGPEWAASGVFTLFAILFILVGAQFVAFGLLGEYIGRIYQEVRQRPPYLVRDLPPDISSGGADEAVRDVARTDDVIRAERGSVGAHRERVSS
jgi:undecaprenyl-phosphate 4-deoxy-4-formamido-L-arabinose transferase